MASEFILMIGGAALFLCLAMALAWLVRQATGKSGWIDAIWSLALGLAAALLALLPVAGNPDRQRLVAALALFWAVRLAGYIGWRTIKGGEDPRYRQLALEWGDKFAPRLFWFLQVQAACALLLALSVLIAACNPSPLGWWDAAGVAVLLAGVLGEGLSDAQLARFRADPTNAERVCQAGLWAWSRHPNYFFEWLAWCAYPLIGISSGHGWGWLTLSAPLLMYWLLTHVSGVPPLEAHMLRSRGEAYRRYQSQVNAFFPFLHLARNLRT